MGLLLKDSAPSCLKISISPIIKDGLVLYLPLYSGFCQNSPIKSREGLAHLCTVTGATWGPTGRIFDGDDDWLTIPATSTQLDFTSSDFTIIMRLKLDLVGPARKDLFSAGMYTSFGYEFVIEADGMFRLRTNQSGAAQHTNSAAGAVTTDTWYTLGVSRATGATATHVYRNGVDATATTQSMLNPVSATIVRKVGGYYDSAVYEIDGIVSDVLAYNRSLSAGEHMDIHNCLSWRV